MVKQGDRVYVNHTFFEGWATVQDIFHGELVPIQVEMDGISAGGMRKNAVVRATRDEIELIKEEGE